MTKISRILHPTDLSDNSRPALRYAAEFARRFDAELHLISVVDIRAFTGTVTEPEFFPADFMEEYVKDRETQLAGLTFEGMQHCRKIVRKLCTGNPISEIVGYAEKTGIDMIIMGTHGRTGLKHLVIGSVAENVVRRATCPVLTVHPVAKKRGKS